MGREGAGIYLMKNHEGYHDPTAEKAIRRADSSKFSGLTYRIGEVPGVPVILK